MEKKKIISQKVHSPFGLLIEVGSKWNYNRELCHSENTQNLVVREIDYNDGNVIIRFEQKMAYEGYGLGYFDGEIFRPVAVAAYEDKGERQTAEEILRKNFGEKVNQKSDELYERGLAGHYPDSIQRTYIYKAMNEFATQEKQQARSQAIRECINAVNVINDASSAMQRIGLVMAISELEKLK